MSKLWLIRRLAGRDLRRRPAQALMLLLAITAATATLTLGLILHGVTADPFHSTQVATAGPDLVANVSAASSGQPPATLAALARMPGVTGRSGPYPVAYPVLQAGKITTVVEAEGRSRAPASVDQPKVTQGSWVGSGGVVIERTFASALGVHVGSRITLNGRSFRVAGTAVTAAVPPYPEVCSVDCNYSYSSTQVSASNVGFIWMTQADARSLATSAEPLTYLLNLKLKHPGRAQALATSFDNNHRAAGAPVLYSWQTVRSQDALLITDEQQVLVPGSWLLGLLAVASVAVLVGGRMAEQTRRVGLLKAVGATPGLVAAILLAEHLAIALLAAAAGLLAGRLFAPLLTSPGDALVGSASAPSLTTGTVVLVVAVALAVAGAATLVPAIRSARTSTVSALADAARPPRRRPWLIEASAGLPVSLLLGMRLAARRPRRIVLNAASVAVTVTALTAVLTYHATSDKVLGSSGLNNPATHRVGQVMLVLTVVAVVLAVVNAIFTAWAMVLDARRSSALSRALGATPQQVTAGLSAAQALPAVPGVIVGIPAGIGLFAAVNGGPLTVPPVWWLLAAAAGTLLAVAVLTAIPARNGARRPVAAVLQSETA